MAAKLTDEQRAAADVAQITERIHRAEAAARAAHDRRAERVQYWYDRGVPISVMRDAAGMKTDYGLSRKVDTAPRGSRRRVTRASSPVSADQ